MYWPVFPNRVNLVSTKSMCQSLLVSRCPARADNQKLLRKHSGVNGPKALLGGAVPSLIRLSSATKGKEKAVRENHCVTVQDLNI